MSGFLTKIFLPSLILAGLALPVLAQNPPETPVPPDRAASFLPSGSATSDSPELPFSGLATPPPVVAASPQVALPSPVPPSVVVPGDKPADITPTPITVAPLPDVNHESIGLQNAQGLGAGMWKGTPRAVAEPLLSMVSLTGSPVLNGLMKRLLVTAAPPPEGTAGGGQSLTAMRAEKLVAFGAAAEAWNLAQHADPKLIDDITFHFVADTMLLSDDQDPCAASADWGKNRASADWQKFMIVCQLRAKDTKAAQVGLDVMRALPNRDTIFLNIADKNILGSSKTLPFQLTPLTADTLALLRQTTLPLPSELYGHPDFALAPALLRATTQQDVAQLALAERAAERGVIDANQLAAVYRSITFPPEALATPLTSSETGLRLHALLFRAAEAEKDPAKRIALTVKLLQSATPAFLNGAGSLLTMMLGDIKPDAAFADNAVALARINMLADRGEVALAWLKLAAHTQDNVDQSQLLWPQFVLVGLEPDTAYATDLGRWLDNALKTASPQADMRPVREAVGGTLLLLDAAGFIVPDADWAKVMTPTHNEKRVALSPVLFERLQAAASGNRKAETILSAVDLAGDEEISLPVAVAITRALRLIGLKTEAAIFARQTAALVVAKSN